MGASNAKTQAAPPAAGPQINQQNLAASLKAQTEHLPQPNSPNLLGSKTEKEDMLTLQAKTGEDFKQDEGMRNLYKKRQADSKFDDYFAEVAQQAAQKQADKQEKIGAKISQQAIEMKEQEQPKLIHVPGGFPKQINPQGTIPSQGDTIAPLKFNAEAGADNKKGGVSEAMMKKMEITFKKKFEKGLERIRARTPETYKREVYRDVIESPIIVDYLKAIKFFQDEMDEEAEQHYFAELKYANDLVSPLRWDSNTVVVDVFRVLQDLTPYIYDYNKNGDMGTFRDFVGNPSIKINLIDPAGKVPIGVKGNKLIDRGNKFIGLTGKDLYSTQTLYDRQLNKNLLEPSAIGQPKQGKALMTLRVEMKQTMTTAILKVPSGNYFEKEILMNQMQQWATIPFHKRIVRPLCFASLNQDLPLIFVEDVPFALSLEDEIFDRSFYKGFQYRFEIAHKILSCIISVIEAVDHAHMNGVMHLNLNPGNILIGKCSQRDQHIGFFVTDFGDPLLLQEETLWTEMQEKTFQRMMKFYPPNILSMIKEAASSQTLQQRREALRNIKNSQNIMIDVYSVGILLLFMLSGGYEWSSTLDIIATFDGRMAQAENLVDLNSLKAMRQVLMKCLLINNEEPIQFIADLLPGLLTAKQNCENILNSNQIAFYDYDKLYKSFYEYLPGQKKENLINADLQIILNKELSRFEHEMHQDKVKAMSAGALNPEGFMLLSPDEIKQKLKKEKSMVVPEINDEDTDSNILNNQAVLAYQKSNYEGCVNLFMKILPGLEGNPLCYFNYLVLCWEAGIYADDFVFKELDRVALNPYTGRSFSSYLFGMLYEAQNNWQAAKVNYGLAFQSASDGFVGEMKLKYDVCREFNEKYPEQFMFGHLEISDVQDIVASYHGRYACSYQKGSRVIVWNLQTQKILKEIEDKNATCMDANAKIDRIVVGLRSGIIVMFNLVYDQDTIVNVEETELGFHTSMVLTIKLSKDGYHGLSGGLDNYLALWNCQKKILLSKIDLGGSILKCGCINMNGEDFMYSTAGSPDVQVYHHSLAKKTINKTFTLRRHQAQVSSVDISYDGLLGVTGGYDRLIYLWDLNRGQAIREINVASFIVKVCLTPMGKFMSATLLDGTLMLYETITGITWRSEHIDGKHSGVAIASTNYMMEVCKEGLEHKMSRFLDQERDRLLKDFQDVRGLTPKSPTVFQKTTQSDSSGSKSPSSSSKNIPPQAQTNIKQKTNPVMPIVPEAAPEDESDYRRTTLRTTQRNEEIRANQNDSGRKQNDDLLDIDQIREEGDIHDVNPEEELMLQDLFFENPVFKFFYFQNDEVTRLMDFSELQQELASINFDRIRDPFSKNQYLLKNSLEQVEDQANLSSFQRGILNYDILQERRKKFNLHMFRSQRQIQQIKELYDICKLVVLAGETRRGEDSEITNQGSIIGLRYQLINIPLLGLGPSFMISHADQTKNIQFKMALKAKDMREKGLQAFAQNNKEQAKYYLQRMRETQLLALNPTAIPVWASLQSESYKKGKIQSVFKVMPLPYGDYHVGPIELMRFCKNENIIGILSKDFIISFWEVGSWKYKTHIKAYHESHAKFYLKDLKADEIMEEFDISVFAFNDGCNLLVTGLYNGMIQFWDLTRSLLSVEIPSHLAEVTQLVFNYDQTILVSSGADYLINVWNAQDRQLMFEIREHLGAIVSLSFVEDQSENDQLIEQLVSIDVEGYMIFVSLDGYIEKKFSVERSSNHHVESMDVVFSAYEVEREMFLVRRNLNTTFFEFQKIKAGVEGYYAAYDTNSFPTIIKNKVDKRRQIQFLQVNQRGEFVCLAQKRDHQITFRNSGNLILEKRIEIKEQIQYVACGSICPYMLVYTDKGVFVYMIEWEIA